MSVGVGIGGLLVNEAGGGGPPPAGVTSFNGRTGAVVSTPGDYLAGVRFSTVAETADFLAIEGVIHIIDSASTDPALEMLLPLNPVDKAVCGFFFNQPTGPFGPTAGLTLNPNGRTVVGNPSPFYFPTRYPAGFIAVIWSAVADTWIIDNWSDFLLSQGAGDQPEVLARYSDGTGRLLFPVVMSNNAVLLRPEGSEIQGYQVNADSVFANFAPKLYTAQSGLGGYAPADFAKSLNTLLPWNPTQFAGDFTAVVNVAHRVVPPDADTIVRCTLPDPAELVGGEQVIVALGDVVGGLVLDALTAGFYVPGKGLVNATPPNTPYTVNQVLGAVLAQYNATAGVWELLCTGYDAARVENSGVINLFLADSGTVDIPGPAAGFVRFYDSFVVVSENGNTYADIDAELLGAPGSPYVLQPVYSTAYSLMNLLATPLGAGESVRLTSTGGGADSRVTANYRDVRDTGVTLVRAHMPSGDVVPAIPVPPAGFFYRWIRTLQSREDWVVDMTCQGPTAQLILPSGASHVVDWYLGGNVLCRNLRDNGPAAQWPAVPANFVCVTVASGALEAQQTSAEPDVSLLGAYEQIPLST